jgi:hypothetical protein
MERREKMRNLIDDVVEHLNRHGIIFFQHDDGLLIPIPTPGGLLMTQVRVLRNNLLKVYSLCNHRAPENKRAAIAEVITRANYGLNIGNFEMDYRDGEIRYKVSMPVDPDQGLTDELLRLVIGVNVTTHARYLPAIEAVLYRDAEPRKAVEDVEGPSEEIGPSSEDIERIVRRLLDQDEEQD